jgi:hypothetical protein
MVPIDPIVSRGRLKCKSVQTMTDPKWSHYSLSPELNRWCSHACFRTTLYVIWNNLVLIPILQRAEFNFQIWNKIDKDNLEYYQKVYILYIINFDFFSYKPSKCISRQKQIIGVFKFLFLCCDIRYMISD